MPMTPNNVQCAHYKPVENYARITVGYLSNKRQIGFMSIAYTVIRNIYMCHAVNRTSFG